MTIKAFRGPESKNQWSSDPYSEQIVTWTGNLELWFKMACSGGITDVSIHINPDSFEELAKAMIKINEDAAIHAFGSALLERG